MNAEQPALAESLEKLLENKQRHIQLYNDLGSSEIVGLLVYDGDRVNIERYPPNDVTVHFGWDSHAGIMYIIGGCKIKWLGDPSLPGKIESYFPNAKALSVQRMGKERESDAGQ